MPLVAAVFDAKTPLAKAAIDPSNLPVVDCRIRSVPARRQTRSHAFAQAMRWGKSAYFVTNRAMSVEHVPFHVRPSLDAY